MYTNGTGAWYPLVAPGGDPPGARASTAGPRRPATPPPPALQSTSMPPRRSLPRGNAIALVALAIALAGCSAAPPAKPLPANAVVARLFRPCPACAGAPAVASLRQRG